MTRKAFVILTAVLLIFACFSFGTAESPQSPGEYGLVQSADITIPVFSEENMKMFEIPDTEALRFTRNLKAGWNLGNTFDAYDNNNSSLGLRLESYWCGVKTPKELFRILKASGFNLVRIPVSWHNHLIDDNYTIDPLWMERVHQVCQWAAEEDLYFIINIHHDNQAEYLYPDSAHYENSEKYIAAIWQQVAENFSDFDDHCIFESMNEPRLVGHPNYEWYLNESAPECRDSAECINRLNQKFVDVVRATGGNNATRYLSVPGYCASPEGALSSLFVIPKDSAENRIIIEVHAYRPYNFALNLSSSDASFDLEKDGNKKSDIAGFMNKLYDKYIANGVPVLIDEFGVLRKNNNDSHLQDRVNLAAYYTASASARGMTCCWWDNHHFSGSGEQFGILSRSSLEWKYPDIALAILRNCTLNRK